MLLSLLVLLPQKSTTNMNPSTSKSALFSVKTKLLLVAICLVLLYARVAIFTMFQSQLPCVVVSSGFMDAMSHRRTSFSSAKLQHDNDTDGPSYAAALSTLRCLSTPNCFPSSKCRTGQPQRIQRLKKWEEHSFCVSDVSQKKDCLVYSFGIHSSWEWEEKAAKLLHCEVHAFDPTMNHPTDLAPGVTFHKLGLQAEGTDMSERHAAEYDAIDPKLLLTLSQIMQQLGHVGRKLDVLALDCEGCEWGALRQLACSGESSLVDQLFVEFHFQTNLGLATPTDVVQAAEGINCLWHHRWHVVSLEQSGSSVEDWEYTNGVTQVIHDAGFLLYASLQRFADDQPRPADLLGRAVQHSRASLAVRERYEKLYQTDIIDRWPPQARDSFNHTKEAELEAYYQSEILLRHPKALFDEHALVDES